MSMEKLSSELHKMIISANPIEATTSDKSALEATLDSNKFDDLRIPTHTVRQKFLYRKSTIQHPLERIRAEGVSGVSGNAYDLKTMMSECENICSFGNGINLTIPKVDKPQKLAKSIPRDPDTVSLTCGCDDIFPNGGTEAQAQSPDEVNFEELASYFENMLNIPKNLPPSAEIMYT
ncbi:uncharacterized protein LOC6734244 [Drosophila simulans]|uniref:Oxidative stress-responsive serine-rich protein 1 n=1 Tax=Drosophila simulans TaxID=7240 RepID=B4QDJ3_DROSI|nr:uncharacterized protein LOC6734244 [Drosophila simulans]EDX06858.1 GD25801 [Drosophila simulans]KMY93380.1 uncharacterized protein Dsimw501_GD25801 [Drosophila simulans]